jgi:hypothetical protein
MISHGMPRAASEFRRVDVEPIADFLAKARAI